MPIESITRKIGNSIGIIVPSDVVKKRKIKPNQKVSFELLNEADLRDLFGTLKTKQTGQQFKDMVRKGWE
jgi:antitoxin component of MazEF toxin-antitoxin module